MPNTAKSDNPSIQLSGIRRFHTSLDKRISSFFLLPSSTLPFDCLRIGVAGVLLFKTATEYGNLKDIYGNRGLVQWVLSEITLPQYAPRMSWFANLAINYGISEDLCVYAFTSLYVFGLCGLLVGWQSKSMACLTWFTHLTLTNSAALSRYGVDMFGNIALFYCILMPIGQFVSIDQKLKRAPQGCTTYSRLCLRLLQFHVCVIYLSAGLEKSFGSQWWNGEVIWRALMMPQFSVYDFSWLANFQLLAKFASWSTLLIEIGYCVFIWVPATRTMWLLLSVGLHVGIGAVLGLWAFSLMMIVLNISAFGTDIIGGLFNSNLSLRFFTERSTYL